MKYRHVCLESVCSILPPQRVTSEEIEAQLGRVYRELHLPEGRLELMTGIRERRFYPPRTIPGEVGPRTVSLAIENSGIKAEQFGALVHGSVCRDQLEPATANRIHHFSALPDHCQIFDLSNACLGLLNGMLLLANMIEMRQIQAGVVVGTEIGRPLVEGTIDALLNDASLTRKSFKKDFASLTIGSGSTAMVLCHEELSRHGTRLIGGVCRSDTSTFELCAGGGQSASDSQGRPRMNTDSEELLHAGIRLAESTFADFRRELNWDSEQIDRVITHQVGKAHRELLLDGLGIPKDHDFPTYHKFGNTGSVALPMALGLAIENGHIRPNHRLALLGIGSGLNSIMLGIDFRGCAAATNIYEQ